MIGGFGFMTARMARPQTRFCKSMRRPITSTKTRNSGSRTSMRTRTGIATVSGWTWKTTTRDGRSFSNSDKQIVEDGSNPQTTLTVEHT